MQIEVRYFASLRDASMMEMEQIKTSAKTVSELFDELNARHTFTIDKKYLRASRDGAYIELDTPLNETDSITFIPPISGG
ncbi:hypothetical protein A3709_12020 [Halioglobus sp. HI00S01]|uniref:MoaD/ThiS family protein n=1 Tax=Halioglobus sp. HI00S01 TaxID=1822214 RepID=UPI0007C276D4|nr:MoaD/ThiS family protein [Halioglobus sp. HI00S01]KZX60311.1 hypothetical protein A3709_12020 [Halioglobus sp. HI00S01]